MKFARCAWEKIPREIEITPRKRAAINHRLSREREAVALLPDLVARVATPEEDIARSRVGARQEHEFWRNSRARDWREARRRLAALPEHTRRGLLRYWNNWCGNGNPAGPEYFTTFVTQAERGHCFWAELRVLRQFQLISQNRLPRTLLFRPGVTGEPPYRRREWRDTNRDFFRRRRMRKLGLVSSEHQRFLALTVAPVPA